MPIWITFKNPPPRPADGHDEPASFDERTRCSKGLCYNATVDGRLAVDFFCWYSGSCVKARKGQQSLAKISRFATVCTQFLYDNLKPVLNVRIYEVEKRHTIILLLSCSNICFLIILKLRSITPITDPFLFKQSVHKLAKQTKTEVISQRWQSENLELRCCTALCWAQNFLRGTPNSRVRIKYSRVSLWRFPCQVCDLFSL